MWQLLCLIILKDGVGVVSVGLLHHVQPLNLNLYSLMIRFSITFLNMMDYLVVNFITSGVAASEARKMLMYLWIVIFNEAFHYAALHVEVLD